MVGLAGLKKDPSPSFLRRPPPVVWGDAPRYAVEPAAKAALSYLLRQPKLRATIAEMVGLAGFEPAASSSRTIFRIYRREREITKKNSGYRRKRRKVRRNRHPKK